MSTPFEERRKAGDREVSAAKRAAGIKYGMSGVKKADFLARLAEVPPDTRDLTARAFGDPIPGRRAIDLRTAR